MALTLDSSYQRIPIDELPLGRPLKGPVYDDNSDILLVAAGTMLTKTVQTALRRRGISHVRIGSQDLRRLGKRKSLPLRGGRTASLRF